LVEGYSATLKAMRCSRCQAENREGLRFCEDCGARLAATCPSCGAEFTPGKKFCGSCGAPVATAQPESRYDSPQTYTPKHLAEKILTSKAAMEGERKQVTVLFADLKGSMELLADRDPEEARKILDPVLERMMEAVHRYEGTVNQVMGDGIMALFGAPLAHEDHAVRACYAALRMQEAVKSYAERLLRAQGVSVQIRVGLNCGDVVVRAIGSDLRMDYTAVGQTTHLAARMEQLAPPGAVYATSAVLRLAEGHVTARSIGPTPIKGLPSPVEIWDITGAGPASLRFEGAASPALTPFVGRDEPLRHLVNALSLAERGEGQLVAVVGEAGVGKSRLFWEFVHGHVTSAWTMLRARSVSYGKASPYLPIVELLKRGFQIGETDTAPAIAARVRDALAALDAALEPEVPALLAVLGVPSDDRQWDQLDPPQRRERVLEAFRRLLLRLALDRPVALLVEDLHWIDDGTQEVLDALVDSLPTARILCLVNYRPEYRHSWAGKSFYTQVRLDPFPADISAHFLDSLLGADVGLVDLRRALVERTQGNPFFLEESVRHLAETGVLSGEPGAYRMGHSGVRIDVPVTVQGVLAARIDRLPPEDKRLLQAAAVVGKDVPFHVLETVAETQGSELRRALARLQGAELLREVRAFPETTYTFKHALTHEVTYGTLLGDRKKALHGAVLETMERLYAARLTEHAETLALHAIAGEVLDRAVDYLREAGVKAWGRGSIQESLEYHERALEVSSRLSPSPENMRRAIDVRVDLHAPMFALGQIPRLIQIHSEAEQLSRHINDDGRLGGVYVRLGAYAWLNAQYRQGIDYEAEALAIATKLNDAKLRVGARHVLGVCHHHLGAYRQAIELFRDNVDGPDADAAKQRLGFSVAPYVGSSGYVAWSLAALGNFEQALIYGDRAVQAADASGHPQAQGFAYAWRAVPPFSRGEFAGSLSWSTRAIEICEKAGAPVLAACAYGFRGGALAWLGRTDTGLSDLERAIVIWEAMGLKGSSARFHFSWAQALLLAGKLVEAKQAADKALKLARATSEQGDEVEALWVQGEIALRREDFDAAQDAFTQADAVAQDLGMRPLVAHCHLGLGRLYRRTGKRQEAQEHLTTATTMYREMDMRFWLEQAEAR
jgi:class 3 adenylate cyclase/tetratricopeptide (TPR) repeat protein/ABC-type thiamine transport system ATPase subunit